MLTKNAILEESSTITKKPFWVYKPKVYGGGNICYLMKEVNGLPINTPITVVCKSVGRPGSKKDPLQIDAKVRVIQPHPPEVETFIVSDSIIGYWPTDIDEGKVPDLYVYVNSIEVVPNGNEVQPQLTLHKEWPYAWISVSVDVTSIKDQEIDKSLIESQITQLIGRDPTVITNQVTTRDRIVRRIHRILLRLKADLNKE